MLKFKLSICSAILSLMGVQSPALGDADPELGDAPEGAIAYPSLGINGEFPTCLGGPAGFIRHGGTSAFWGATVDTEPDGNANFCPQPPYDRDECHNSIDIDSGMSRPMAFTIDPGLNVITCSGKPGTSLGSACGTAYWGANGSIDMQVSNFSGTEAYVNIWFDWNQDGKWGGQVLCPSGGPIDEHVVIDAVIYNGYAGVLSAIHPGSFPIGPNDGYVWARFTVSVPAWSQAGGPDGSGDFDEGETEDYLLRIDPAVGTGELGDAPEDEPAYPGLSGVKGQFPTCVAIGPAGFVYHANPNNLYFGPSADVEGEGNAGFCPQPPYDEDECDASGGDSGLLMPDAYSIDAGFNIVACPGNPAPAPLGVTCQNIAWGVDLDLTVTNNLGADAYLNVLVDLNRSGEWSGNSIVCGGAAREHVLENFPIPSGYSGPVSALAPPGFVLAARGGYVWCRFTLGERLMPSDWDGSGYMGDGETEDYLFAVRGRPTDTAPQAMDPLQLRVNPNPFNPNTRISFELPQTARTHVTIHDIAGRLVNTLLDEQRDAGHHVLPWNGNDAHGMRLGSGIYVVRIVAGDEVRTAKVVMTK